jgi:hypothetical protein
VVLVSVALPCVDFVGEQVRKGRRKPGIHKHSAGMATVREHAKDAMATARLRRWRSPRRCGPVLANLADLSANGIAAVLNERGAPTAAGAKWTAVQVLRVRQRLK